MSRSQASCLEYSFQIQKLEEPKWIQRIVVTVLWSDGVYIQRSLPADGEDMFLELLSKTEIRLECNISGSRFHLIWKFECASSWHSVWTTDFLPMYEVNWITEYTGRESVHHVIRNNQFTDRNRHATNSMKNSACLFVENVISTLWDIKHSPQLQIKEKKNMSTSRYAGNSSTW